MKLLLFLLCALPCLGDTLVSGTLVSGTLGETVTNAPASSGLLTSLTAVWEMEANDNADNPDATGNNHTLYVLGATTRRTTHIQGTYSDSGSPTAYYTNNEAVFKTQGSFSFSLWINSQDIADDAFAAQRWGAGGNAWGLYILSGVPNFVIRNSTDTAGYNAISLNSISGTAWHLIVCTYNDTDKKARISVDGETLKESNTSDDINSSTEPLILGPLSRYTDEVAWWDGRVLTQDDVAELWAGGSGKFYAAW